MTVRVYFSNMTKAWSLARQEALFKERVPGWPTSVARYSDIIPPSRLKHHDVTRLIERANLIRPTSRRVNDEVIYVAALTCMAFHEADLLVVLNAISARRATLIALDDGLTIPPNPGISEITEATTRFRQQRRSTRTGAGVAVGAAASALARVGRAKAGCDAIAERWALPSGEHPTVALLKEADVSRATAKKYLRPRKIVQRERELALAQAARNRSRRKADA